MLDNIIKKKFGKTILHICPNRDVMGEAAAIDAANRLRILLSEQETVNALFAAAPSQQDFLSSLAKQKNIDWHRVNGFHMDEYIGLKPDAPQSFKSYLKKAIFDLVPFKKVYYMSDFQNKTKEENLNALRSNCKLN